MIEAEPILEPGDGKIEMGTNIARSAQFIQYPQRARHLIQRPLHLVPTVTCFGICHGKGLSVPPSPNLTLPPMLVSMELLPFWIKLTSEELNPACGSPAIAARPPCR